MKTPQRATIQNRNYASRYAAEAGVRRALARGRAVYVKGTRAGTLTAEQSSFLRTGTVDHRARAWGPHQTEENHTKNQPPPYPRTGRKPIHRNPSCFTGIQCQSKRQMRGWTSPGGLLSALNHHQLRRRGFTRAMQGTRLRRQPHGTCCGGDRSPDLDSTPAPPQQVTTQGRTSPGDGVISGLYKDI